MIYGRVDELRNGKALGWAYDSDNPDGHLNVSIRRGRDVIASGIADVYRSDLPDAGVGAGDHAFEILLPSNIVSFQGLTFAASSENAGETLLPIATNDERHLDDLFQIFAGRYDKALRALKSDIDDLKETGTGQAVLDDVDGRMKRIEKRIEEMEVFIMRLDETSRVLQQHVGLAKKKSLFARMFGR